MSDSDDHVDEMSTESPFGGAHISSHSCRETLLDKFETLANQLAGGWKYHSPQQLVADPQRERLALTHPYSRRISPYLCQKKLVEKVDALASQLSPSWSYHISNTEGIVEAWQDFEHYFLRMCTMDHGKRLLIC
ncbi:unnamed protein product [Toxocara canis]|uniref:Retrotrans_gag domain-containing protein n=1 Tax=Toxocara canis TaxID=6265 RepID=A0A183VH26_TOXCA|nr:unnamed protein product [Toxocara canis]